MWCLVLGFSCSVCADGSCAGSCCCLAQCCRGGDFFHNSAVFGLVLGISIRVWGISRLCLNSLAALVVLPFSSVCLSYASTVACGGWPGCFFFFAVALLTGCPCVCVWVLSDAAELCLLSSCSARGRLLLSLLLVFASVPLPAAPAVFPRRYLPQVTLRGFRILSGSSCLSCSGGGARSLRFAVSFVRRLVFNLVPCSSSEACGFARLPLPQVTLWGFCLF